MQFGGKRSMAIALAAAAFMVTTVFLASSTQADGASAKMELVYFDPDDYTYSTYQLHIWDLPLDHELYPGGIFPGWCMEEDEYVYGEIEYSVTVYNSYDTSSFPDKWSTFEFDKVNWILNNRGDYSMNVIQEAIWHFTGSTTPASTTSYFYEVVWNLIDDANTYGDGYMPSTEDEIIAYLVDNGDNQDMLFEVPYTPDDHHDGGDGARTIGYWKTHEEVWENWVPETDSIFYQYYDSENGLDQDTLLSFFPGRIHGNVDTWIMVRAQLLAVELNVGIFGPGTSYDFDYGEDVYDMIDDATEFLNYHCTIDSNGGWEGPNYSHGTSAYHDYRSTGSDIISDLDDFNNMGDSVFE